MFEVKDKVAIVTGGASGIGFSFAQELLKNGIKGVTIVDINETCGTNALKQLQETYGKNRVIFEKVDVSNVQQFEGAFIRTVETFKNVDILINIAGILDERIWEKEISVNLIGTINGTLLGMHNYINKYKGGSDGVIVNVSSVGGLDISTGFPVYCATKHAVTAFSRGLGCDFYYNMNKVRVFCVCPGAVATPLMQEFLVKTLKPEYSREFKKRNVPICLQEPSFVAEKGVDLIKHAPNGSVWVIEDMMEPYKVEFPTLENMLKR